MASVLQTDCKTYIYRLRLFSTNLFKEFLMDKLFLYLWISKDYYKESCRTADRIYQYGTRDFILHYCYHQIVWQWGKYRKSENGLAASSASAWASSWYCANLDFTVMMWRFSSTLTQYFIAGTGIEIQQAHRTLNSFRWNILHCYTSFVSFQFWIFFKWVFRTGKAAVHPPKHASHWNKLVSGL